MCKLFIVCYIKTFKAIRRKYKYSYSRSFKYSKKNEDIVSACDKLLLSLKNAEIDDIKMMKQIEKINSPV